MLLRLFKKTPLKKSYPLFSFLKFFYPFGLGLHIGSKRNLVVLQSSPYIVFQVLAGILYSSCNDQSVHANFRAPFQQK